MYHVEIKDGHTNILHDGRILGRVQRMVIEVGVDDSIPRMHLDVILARDSHVVADIADDNVTAVATVAAPGPTYEIGPEAAPVDFVPTVK
jgi:hypothetical protein